MDMIRPWLYIGKYLETLESELLLAKQIQANLHLADPDRITSVMDFAERKKVATITSLYLPVEDAVPLPIPLLRQGIDFVITAHQQRKTILISCGAGISRSASFAVAVLKEIEHIDLLTAVQIVKRCHPQTQPHRELWNTLCQYYGEKVSADYMMHLLCQMR